MHVEAELNFHRILMYFSNVGHLSVRLNLMSRQKDE
jgi:hypothetical protein